MRLPSLLVGCSLVAACGGTPDSKLGVSVEVPVSVQTVQASSLPLQVVVFADDAVEPVGVGVICAAGSESLVFKKTFDLGYVSEMQVAAWLKPLTLDNAACEPGSLGPLVAANEAPGPDDPRAFTTAFQGKDDADDISNIRLVFDPGADENGDVP